MGKKKGHSIMIVVDFKEFKPKTYKGCYLFENGTEFFRSSTGKFKKDYKIVLKRALEISKLTGKVVINSSSVDDWYMDNHK